MAEQRWRAADMLLLGIGLIASCQTFRTIDEHAGSAATQLEPSGIAAARAQLETFARDGLLVKKTSLRVRCQRMLGRLASDRVVEITYARSRVRGVSDS